MAQVDLTTTDCWCGLPFAMPTRLYEQCKKNGNTFYCPLGHTVVFRESDVDRMRRARDLLKQQIAERDDRISDLYGQVETEERRTAAYKGHITKLKKRASAGVCPCCNRTFQNLHRHMTTKHPDYTTLEVIEGGAA